MCYCQQIVENTVDVEWQSDWVIKHLIVYTTKILFVNLSVVHTCPKTSLSDSLT